MGKKQIKVGVLRGQGDPPYEWNVDVLDLAFEEAMRFLTEDQYDHLAKQFQELARQGDPTHSATISLDAIEDFYELRDWGSILYPCNVRVFFGVQDSTRTIIVLGTIDKRNNGPTPPGDKVRMRRRWRKYKNGDYQ